MRVPWDRIAEFGVERPGALWGGYCVIATCHDGSKVDLLSARAYALIPSSRHYDDLHRLAWALEETRRDVAATDDAGQTRL